MLKHGIYYLIIIFVAMAASCHPEKKKHELPRQSLSEFISSQNISGFLIADTIIYDVIIKNPNPYDKWAEKCLSNLKKEAFIDFLFESIYKKQTTAHDLYTDKIITPDELKSLERNKEFNRNKIGKIQFTESWFYSDSLRSMSKKVISVTLGYEILDDKGELIGHKPAFKIYLN
ncbi:MAG: hypothetical protein JW723_10180 [Bacteroidales bacterium]|nr:hypothetical protein [Bacteroidales bacterium]